jgi:hypothetical protein
VTVKMSMGPILVKPIPRALRSIKNIYMYIFFNDTCRLFGRHGVVVEPSMMEPIQLKLMVPRALC